MKRGAVSLCVVLAATLCAGLAPCSAIEDIPIVTEAAKTENLESLTPERQAKCRQAGEKVQKWVGLFRMSEWTVTMFCMPRPPWEDPAKPESGLRGACIPFPERKAAYLWLNLDDPEVEKVAIHELLHMMFAYDQAAASRVVTENLVENVSRIIADLNFALAKEAKSEKKLLAAIGRKD